MIRSLRLVPAALALLIAACSDSSTGPAAPQPILGLQATATGSASIRLSFNSRVGDGSYRVERAEGTATTFTSVTTLTAPAAAATLTYDDVGLKVTTAYRYRVITIKGSAESIASGEANATTLAFGSATAEINADITTSRTLFADTAYTLKGFIHVANGATLTIQAGTTIRGDFNTLGSSLFIMRGARIQAIGTADAPIVFTSSRPAGQRAPGDWGGLVIVGNAPINRSGVVEVEGTGTDGQTVVSGKNYQVLYSGGTVATDNSGELRYVRVEFAGFAPSLNNELNSFTFAAVGSGTRVSYVESMAGLDDSFEFFGGGFDFTNAVAYEGEDDQYDMSEGWNGRMQFLISYKSAILTPRTGAGSPASDPQGIENDGCNGSGCDQGFNTAPLTIPVVANFTLIGPGDIALSGSAGGVGMMLRRGTGGYYVNGVVARWARAGVSLRDTATFQLRGGGVQVQDLAVHDLALKNIVFSDVAGVIFQAPAGSTQQGSLDLAGNALTNSSAAAASLFAAIPAVGAAPASANALDFTPAAGSAIASGGLTTFTGKLATKAGTFITGTSYQGAAAPTGAKWWQGWTSYARN
ncbi:MAG: hypothetical protein K2X99_06585 [Gemmatimonadaceae bacterium]|nr:hypothetical protein [Gemmatimonadaceae bacterium]